MSVTIPRGCERAASEPGELSSDETTPLIGRMPSESMTTKSAAITARTFRAVAVGSTDQVKRLCNPRAPAAAPCNLAVQLSL